MRRWIIGLFAAVLWTADQAAAEPYIAVREGYKCSACHVNMTGGGMRTSFVAAHAREILHYPDWFAALTKPADAFSGELNQYVAIGADLRTNLSVTMQDTPKNGTVPNDVVFRGRLESVDINVNEAVGYLNVNLIPDVLNFYLDQRFAPSVDTREVWGMFMLPNTTAYAKAGKMFLPYGLQIQDDTAFIRGGNNGSATTGFSFNTSQPAFEIGWEPGPMSFAVAVSQGVVNDSDVQLTGTDYLLFTDLPVIRSFMVGISGSYNGGDTATAWFGCFTGFNLYRFTYLGEVDFGNINSNGNANGKNFNEGLFNMYSEGNYLAFDWLNVKAAFDYADWDGQLPRVGSDSENRVSVGLEPFLARFLQLRLFFRTSNGIATNPTHNQNLWYAELHMFF